MDIFWIQFCRNSARVGRISATKKPNFGRPKFGQITTFHIFVEKYDENDERKLTMKWPRRPRLKLRFHRSIEPTLSYWSLKTRPQTSSWRSFYGRVLIRPHFWKFRRWHKNPPESSVGPYWCVNNLKRLSLVALVCFCYWTRPCIWIGKTKSKRMDTFLKQK